MPQAKTSPLGGAIWPGLKNFENKKKMHKCFIFFLCCISLISIILKMINLTPKTVYLSVGNDCDVLKNTVFFRISSQREIFFFFFLSSAASLLFCRQSSHHACVLCVCVCVRCGFPMCNRSWLSNPAPELTLKGIHSCVFVPVCVCRQTAAFITDVDRDNTVSPCVSSWCQCIDLSKVLSSVVSITIPVWTLVLRGRFWCLY